MTDQSTAPANSLTLQAPYDHLSIPDLLRGLHEKRFAIDSLPPHLRQACVSHLTAEGFSAAEIGSVLGVTDRTIRRDRAAIRRREAVTPSITLGDELLGELHSLTLLGIQRLTRLANETTAPFHARVWAEEAIVRMYQRLLDAARRLNYIEDGKRRLRHVRDGTNPHDERRRAQALAALIHQPTPQSHHPTKECKAATTGRAETPTQQRPHSTATETHEQM